MWNEYLLDYWSLLVLKYTAALINGFGPSLSWCKLPRLNAAEQIYIIWRHGPWRVGAAAFWERGISVPLIAFTAHLTLQIHPGLLWSGHFGEEGRAPLLFVMVCILFCVWLCSADGNQWSKGDFWGPCTSQSPGGTGCSSPPSQPHCQSYSVCKCSYFYGHFMTLLCGTYNFNGWKSN